MSINNINHEDVKNALSQSDAQWEADITIFSSLPIEKQKIYLGAKPPEHEPSIEEIEQRVSSKKESLRSEALQATGVPTSYDLRNVGGKNFITEVKDQKSCGSCVAFGTIATAEGSMRVQNNNPNRAVDFSEAQLFFCYGAESGATCDSGWWPPYAYDAFQKKGVVDEDCYRYDDGLEKKDCSGLCADADSRKMRISGYTDLTGKPAQIKEWISSNGPVSACFIVYQDFMQFYKGGIYKHVTGEKLGGHCVSIIGYNDDEGYWICKNSWATIWGEQGFFRIAYGECGIDSWSNHGVEWGC
ncbi:C1 family peptidase [Bacillus sp. GMa5/1]|uniref:C1 family peptidase n=1 Tax=Bacillus sp. GMa5/1 TaxID=3418496 RepID=UPI003CF9AF10